MIWLIGGKLKALVNSLTLALTDLENIKGELGLLSLLGRNLQQEVLTCANRMAELDAKIEDIRARVNYLEQQHDIIKLHQKLDDLGVRINRVELGYRK